MGSNRDLVPVTAGGLLPGDRDGNLGRGRKVLSTRDNGAGRIEVTMAFPSGKKERWALDPTRRFSVERVVVGPRLPLRWRGDSSTTGARVEVFDSRHPESPVGPVRDRRWVMRCEHGTVAGRVTMADAVADADDPRLWCVSCVVPAPRAEPALF